MKIYEATACHIHGESFKEGIEINKIPIGTNWFKDVADFYRCNPDAEVKHIFQEHSNRVGHRLPVPEYKIYYTLKENLETAK